MKTLPRSFFERSAVPVARDLIGKTLARRMRDGSVARHLITETEAYEGPNDLASHASKGATPRASAMFGHPRTLYVYLVYGMHHMLNVVTGKAGHPGAVLIRGVEGIDGPGRLTKRLAITRTLNGLPALPSSGLWFENAPSMSRRRIKRTPRIGVSYAGPVWSQKPYRFVLERKDGPAKIAGAVDGKRRVSRTRSSEARGRRSSC